MLLVVVTVQDAVFFYVVRQHDLVTFVVKGAWKTTLHHRVILTDNIRFDFIFLPGSSLTKRFSLFCLFCLFWFKTFSTSPHTTHLSPLPQLWFHERGLQGACKNFDKGVFALKVNAALQVCIFFFLLFCFRFAHLPSENTRIRAKCDTSPLS